MSKGLTLIEVIISLAVIGIVITPIISMFLVSAKINSESNLQYKSIFTAQKYIEEIMALDEINFDNFVYNSLTKAYERRVTQTAHELGAVIRIITERSYFYLIEVLVYNDGKEIYSLSGSKIIK
jgi:prepilin-type N-terminal cleavage/methylation domain-containing protein